MSNYVSMALQTFVGIWPHFFRALILYTAGRTPWMAISRSQSPYLHIQQHKHRINAHTHPCLQWDSNPVHTLDSAATMNGIYKYSYRISYTSSLLSDIREFRFKIEKRIGNPYI
jgi:hypothetical protein